MKQGFAAACVVGSCAFASVASADGPPQHQHATRTSINAGISIFDDANGLYGRVSHKLTPRMLVHVLGHFAPGSENGPIDSPDIYVEGILEGRAKRPDYEKVLGNINPFHRGWRLGAFFRSYVPPVLNDNLMNYGYTESKVLAAFAGYGIGIESKLLRATVSIDVIYAPLVSYSDFVTEMGDPAAFEGNVDRLGGRAGLLVNFGPKRYGFCFDVGVGYLPSIDRRLTPLAVLGFYLGI